jgi:hypothetical protein
MTWDFHGDNNYWDFNIIGYDTVQFDKLLPHSWKNQLSEYEGRKFLQTLLAISQTTRRHNTHKRSVTLLRKKFRSSSEKSQFTSLIAPVIKYKLCTIILIQMFLLP